MADARSEMRLSEIRERLTGSRKGPWIRSGCRIKLGEESCIPVGPDGYSIAFLPIGYRPAEHAGALRDADFIAHAPSDVQYLLDYVAELEARLGDRNL